MMNTDIEFSKACFRKVLSTPDIYQLFRHFAETIDHTAENLYYMEDIQNFGPNIISVGFTSKSSTIYIPEQTDYIGFAQKYINPSSSHEINIPNQVRTKIMMKLTQVMSSSTSSEHLSPLIFEEATDEVLSMLYMNTFKRFVKYMKSKNQFESMSRRGDKGVQDSDCSSVYSFSSQTQPQLELLDFGDSFMVSLFKGQHIHPI